jgi:ABC-type antimicrobial peptide transport system permease subunit
MNSKAQHYIKSAWNNFRHNKWYVSLMIFSLSTGIFCFILASIYINFEYSRNANHENTDRVHLLKLKRSEGRVSNFSIPYDFASQLDQLNPDIEAVSLLDNGRDLYLSSNGKDYIYQEDTYYSDPGFFKVFTFPLRFGNEETALAGPKKIVISSKLSSALFGEVNPVGEEVQIYEKGNFVVSGVLEDVPSTSLLNPSVVFSLPQLFEDMPYTREFGAMFTHIKISSSADIQNLNESLYKAYESMGIKTREQFFGLESESLADAYWGYSHYNYGAQYSSLTGNNKRMIRTIGYVSIGVLVCAFVGYLSISLSISLKRAKEIGVRKVNGAGRGDIKIQLLSESVFYALVSLVLTIIALELSSDYFTNVFKVPIGLKFTSPLVIVLLVAFTLIIGVLSGWYPAFQISKLNPIKALSGYNSPNGSGFRLRQVLIALQLSLTVVLVFGVLIQYNQMSLLMNFDHSYEKENTLTFGLHQKSVRSNYQAILDEIGDIPGVKEISGGPFPFSFNGSPEFIFDSGDSLIKSSVSQVLVKENFIETMKLEMASGETFLQNSEVPTSMACIVNEAFVRELGQEALGITFSFNGKQKTVIGVVKDYVDIGVNNIGRDARVLLPSEGSFHSLLIKYDPDQYSTIQSKINDIWTRYEPVINPDISRLEDKPEYGALAIQSKARLFGFLAIMVLILSLLNLFGISQLFALSKQKNISIRRVLGAEVMHVFMKLSNPFLIVLVFSLMIALPVAYYIMEEYLNDYNVRIDLNWTYGAWVSLSMLILLFLVIGYQLLKVSRVNPATVLKDE